MAFEQLIGPVTTEIAAAEVERAGASLVAIMPAPLPRFSAGACVPDLDAAEQIGRALARAELCLWWDLRLPGDALRAWCARLKPGCVMVDARQPEAQGQHARVRSAAPRLLLIGPALDYDEDPAWTEGQLHELFAQWGAEASVLTLLPGLRQPIAWLRAEAGAHPEDVTVADIEPLLRTLPLLLNVAGTGEELAWLRGQLPSARGFAHILGEPRDDGAAPVFTPADARKHGER